MQKLKTFIQSRPPLYLACLALIIAGLSVIAYGAYSYFDAQQAIEDNAYYQAKNSDEPLEIPDNRAIMTSIGQQLYESQQEYETLLGQRGRSIRLAGAGLALIGGGWLGADLVASRQRRAAAPDDEATTPSSEEAAAS